MALVLLGTALAVEPPLQIADGEALEGSAEVQIALQEAWQAERLSRAKTGQPEWVRLPLAFRSMGWGCPCPMVFVGTNTSMFTMGPWLSLTYVDGVVPPSPGPAGEVVVAEGRFLGKTERLDLQPEGEDIPELLWAPPGVRGLEG